MPLIHATSLCQVVVTWERRTRDTRMFAFERYCSRGTRLSTAEPECGFDTNPTPTPTGLATSALLSPGADLTNHGLPAYCIVEETTSALAQRKAFQLACQLWSSGTYTRLVLEKTSVREFCLVQIRIS